MHAAIDVGSNTIRTLIGTFRDGKLRRLFSDRNVTRLDEGIKETGYLKEKNIELSINALRNISKIISNYKVIDVRAVGTEALRVAKNSHDFIERVFRETGIRIRIISGEEEARLTVRGVLSGLDVRDSLIIDIGGGSTEWVIYDSKRSSVSYCESIPIGVVSLFEDHIKHDPPTHGELKTLEHYIEGPILQLLAGLPGKPTGANLIGTGGTITTLAAIDLSLDNYQPEIVHGHLLSLDRLKDMRNKLISLPISLRKDIKGLERERADLIIPGIILTIKIMDIFQFDEMIVSDYGLLEGLLLEGGEDEKGL